MNTKLVCIILIFFIMPLNAKTVQQIKTEITEKDRWLSRQCYESQSGYFRRFQKEIETYIENSGLDEKTFIRRIYEIVKRIEPNENKWKTKLHDQDLILWWLVLAACGEEKFLKVADQELLKEEEISDKNYRKKSFLLNLLLLNRTGWERICRQIISKKGVFVYLRFDLFRSRIEEYILIGEPDSGDLKIVDNLACNALKTEYNYRNLIQEDEFLIRLHGEKYENNIQRINFLKQRVPQTELPRHRKESTLMQNNIKGKLKELSQTKQLYDHNLLECLRDDFD